MKALIVARVARDPGEAIVCLHRAAGPGTPGHRLLSPALPCARRSLGDRPLERVRDLGPSRGEPARERD